MPTISLMRGVVTLVAVLLSFYHIKRALLVDLVVMNGGRVRNIF